MEMEKIGTVRGIEGEYSIYIQFGGVADEWTDDSGYAQ